MKRLATCVTLVTLLASFAAHADDVEPVVARASFQPKQTPTLDVITLEACGLRPASRSSCAS